MKRLLFTDLKEKEVITNLQPVEVYDFNNSQLLYDGYFRDCPSFTSCVVESIFNGKEALIIMIIK